MIAGILEGVTSESLGGSGLPGYRQVHSVHRASSSWHPGLAEVVAKVGPECLSLLMNSPCLCALQPQDLLVAAIRMSSSAA